MKRAAATVAALWCLVLAACASTPTARWAQSRDTLTTTQDLVLILHEAGAVSDETLVHRIDPAVQVARAALQKAEEALPDGPGVYDYLEVAEAAVGRLAAVRAEYVAGGDQ